MTAPARITQADMDRAVKSVKDAGIERARIIMRLASSEIEIILGESADETPQAPSSANPWDSLLHQ